MQVILPNGFEIYNEHMIGKEQNGAPPVPVYACGEKF